MRLPMRSPAATGSTSRTNSAICCCRCVPRPQMAEEEGAFAFPDVVEADHQQDDPPPSACLRRCARSVARRGQGALAQIKAQEKVEKAAARKRPACPADEDKGVLAGVTARLPALSRAWKLQAKASTVGFDWNDATSCSTRSGRRPPRSTRRSPGRQAAIREEIGDLLFVVANLARHVDADPEGCLHAANAKFERRFQGIEAALEAEGRTAKDATLDEMEALWQAVKRAEKAGAV
jgi:ATP diphosphatase